jgi:acyl transferase domain-containing protein
MIGMALRFPGAHDAEQFWANLEAGVDCISTFDRPAQRAAGLSTAAISDPDRRPVGGALDGIGSFDPGFFGMSPKEASLTHPAHRLFLECCYEALEGAGYAAADDPRIGVFAGAGMNLYGYQAAATIPASDLGDAMLASLGGQPDFLASRVAYRLGLTGPAVGVQTACSTALVAVHLALQALRSGDADLVLAGAAAVHSPQGGGYRLHPGSVLSRSGRCRPFDAAADGTVGGNGVAVVLLKPLEAALADGDLVHAVISGSAVNNDGRRKVGFAAPSVPGQVEVIRTALDRAGISGNDLCYVEAHGTGTPLGDPLEFDALSQAIGAGSGRTGCCAIGSVKSSIGHLDSCSGLAGLIKVVLMLRHRLQVPTRNLEHPNPALRLADSPFTLTTEVRRLRPAGAPDAPLRAGVSSLGVGGTNAFVVIEEAPPPPPRNIPSRTSLVPLSAQSRQALDELAGRLGRWLRVHPETPAVDVAASLAARPMLSERAAVIGSSAAELADALEGFRSAPPSPGELPAEQQGIAFAFAGQGRLRPGAARELYQAFPAVRETLDECDRAYREVTGDSLLPGLIADADPREYAQPALFSLHVAMAAMWRSWGIEPGYVLGHSLGEIAALCVAGAFSMAEGVRLTAVRGLLMDTRTPAGGLLAVRGELPVVARIARQSGLTLAVRNGDRDFVLSGAAAALSRGTELLDKEHVACLRLDADRAYHSALLDPILADLRAAAERCTFAPIRLPVITGLAGAIIRPGSVMTPDDVVAHASSQVRFDLVLETLGRTGCGTAVDIGPSDELSRLGRRGLPKVLWASTQPCGGDGERGALLALGELYRSGRRIGWDGLTDGGRRMPLPGYPFQRKDLTTTWAGAQAKEPVYG